MTMREETSRADQYVKDDERDLIVCLTLIPYTVSMKEERMMILLTNPAHAK